MNLRPHPYRAHRLIEEVLIPVHSHLMGSAHQLQTVYLVELLRHVCTKDPACSAEIALETTR